MKLVLQRVSRASVTAEGALIATIGAGLVVLVCAEPGDDDATAAFLARKVAAMRIFADANGKMNHSLIDIAGEALVISQFTLAAGWRKGNRPDFSAAAPAAEGEALYDRFCRYLAERGVAVARGRFGASMQVALVNDGPVTVWMDSRDGG